LKNLGEIRQFVLAACAGMVARRVALAGDLADAVLQSKGKGSHCMEKCISSVLVCHLHQFQPFLVKLILFLSKALALPFVV